MRRAPRLPVDLEGSLRGRVVHPVRLLDLSLTGCLVRCDARLDPGAILLFSVVTQRAEAFHATLTFTQGHLAFSPDPANPLQLGLLQGRLGDLEAGEVVLGWIALPPAMDLRRPIGVYWNDRHTEVTFVP